MSQRLKVSSSSSLHAAIIKPDPNDRIIEGLRIPSSLDSTYAVNFVLTQEAGKLKPKDLKLAIENNRRERERRVEEQNKLREQGGGAGGLDGRGILAEERLNYATGDPFRRQLREIAFLADVEEVEKQEIEKEFRISEDYIGSNLLSDDAIAMIQQQRKLAQQHQHKYQWNAVLSRHNTAFYPPTHATVKAGTLSETAQEIMQNARPLFDPNRNDIWAKRLNTLRRFIALISKWLIRKRVNTRISKLLNRFHEHNAFTREEILAFIDIENVDNQANAIATSSNAVQPNETITYDASAEQKALTFIEMVFSEPNEALTRRLRNESILQTFQSKVKHNEAEFTTSMASRNLFPLYDRSNQKASNATALVSSSTILQELVTFDDRTFYHLRQKPDYVTKKYQPFAIPTTQLYFPLGDDKKIRLEGPEEQLIPTGIDANLTATLLQQAISQQPAIMPKEVDEMSLMRQKVVADVGDSGLFPRLHDTSPPAALDASITSIPAWLSNANIQYPMQERDFITNRAEYRVYKQYLPYAESDALYPFRPCLEQHAVHYQVDKSLRSTWMNSIGGFQSVNEYLLGKLDTHQKLATSSDTSSKQHQIPEAGPTLIDFYLPDHDRHTSGTNCFHVDHQRALLEWDQDVKPLQVMQDKADYLTDSESDNEDGYQFEKPSLKQVKKILTAPVVIVKKEEVLDKGKKPADKGKGKEKEKEKAKDIKPVESTVDNDDDALLDESERKEEQVELLRDRKTLDVSSQLRKQCQQHLEAVHAKYAAIASKGVGMYALDISMPFHMYEESVYKYMTSYVPVHNQMLIEMDPNALGMMSQPPTSMSVTTLPPFSPER